MDSSPTSPGTDTSGEEARQWEMDELIGYILQAGVFLSMALVAAGLVWAWLARGRVTLNYHLTGMNLFDLVVSEFRLPALRDIGAILLVNCGIVVLMLTPYFRVLASIIYFAAVLKNWKYTLFTSIVLIVLTYSLFLRA